MEKKEMTLHRALSELKLIDAKIAKQIEEINPTGVKQKGKLVNGHVKEDDFNTSAQSKFDSITTLLERKGQIKSALVDANAKTKVNVAGKEMTIADAINFKESIKMKQFFIDNLKSKYKMSVAKMNNHNTVVEQNCQKLLEASFGKDNVKSGKEDVEAIRKPFMENNEASLVNPLDVEKKADDMQKELDAFQSEVDAVLSEVNAITKITV